MTFSSAGEWTKKAPVCSPHKEAQALWRTLHESSYGPARRRVNTHQAESIVHTATVLPHGSASQELEWNVRGRSSPSPRAPSFLISIPEVCARAASRSRVTAVRMALVNRTAILKAHYSRARETKLSDDNRRAHPRRVLIPGVKRQPAGTS